MIARQYFRTTAAAKITQMSPAVLNKACNRGYLAHIKLNLKSVYIPDFEVYAIVRYKLEHPQKRFVWEDFKRWRETLTWLELR